MDKLLLSTGSDYWETPQTFFNELDNEFHFTLDPCCTHKNAKCDKHYTEIENGLLQDWSGEVVFCNPPYSKKGKQDLWVQKCFYESLKPDTIVVLLIPARTDTARFHDFILGKAEIRFLRGRLNFEINGEPIRDKKGNFIHAPFPSMLVIFR